MSDDKSGTVDFGDLPDTRLKDGDIVWANGERRIVRDRGQYIELCPLPAAGAAGHSPEGESDIEHDKLVNNPWAGILDDD